MLKLFLVIFLLGILAIGTYFYDKKTRKEDNDESL